MDRRLPSLDGRARASLALLALLIAAFWLWGAFSANTVVERAISFLEASSQEHRFLSAAAFFAFALLSVLLGPLTSAPLVPIGIAAWGAWLTFWLLLLGWIVGGGLAYAIGRFAGTTLVTRFVSKAEMDRWSAYVSRHTTFFTALLFRLAMPAETGYVFGIVRYHLGAFFAITILVEIPFALALVFAGDAFAAQDFPVFVSWIAGTFLVLSGAIYLLKKRLAT